MPSLSTFWHETVTCFTRDEGGTLCGAISLSTLSAVLLLLAQVSLGYEGCRCRGQSGREAMAALYSLLGNVCSATGAMLSRQPHFLAVLGAFSATLDAMAVITLCLPLCLCWNSKEERKLRARRRRRRQLLFVVCALMGISGGFLKVGLRKSEVDSAPMQRRLLQDILEVQNASDYSYVLGYILGVLSFAIAYTSRLPAVYREHKKQMTRAQMLSRLLFSLSGVCCASAIMFYDTSDAFIWRTLPWLLSAVLCAIMDLLVVLVYLCKRRSTTHCSGVFSPDTESLLRNSVKEREKEQKTHIIPQTQNKDVERATGTDCYLDVTTPPERKSSVEIELCRKERNKEVLANSSMQEKDDDSFCTSHSHSSVASSDLEWDFEEPNMQWCEPPTKPQKGKLLPQV